MTAAAHAEGQSPTPPELTRKVRPVRVDLWLFGCGNVGRELWAMIAQQSSRIAQRRGVDLRVIAITTTRGTWFDNQGLLPGALGERAAEKIASLALIRRVAAQSSPMLVDLSAAVDAPALYAEAAAAGLAIVTANKLPFVGAFSQYERLLQAARNGRGIFYETTVGADLPVLAPIIDRVQSGDQIVRIEGSFSGTLGLLSDAVSRGVSLDKAVLDAKAQGTTEPDPREDLSGRDVARKALIIARELGLGMELDDIELDGFVSRDVLDAADTIGLEAALAEEAPRISARARGLARAGSVLRYLATIDPSSTRPVHVGLVAVGPEHPAASLRGTEAMVTITSARTAGYPITIRGPGAGGAVTASGVLADIMRAAR